MKTGFILAENSMENEFLPSKGKFFFGSPFFYSVKAVNWELQGRPLSKGIRKIMFCVAFSAG
jgi:hypothetical protein